MDFSEATNEESSEQRLKRLRDNAEEVYKALGKFVVKFERMCQWMRTGIVLTLQTRGLQDQELCRIVVAGVNNRIVREKLEAIVAFHYGEESKEFQHARQFLQKVQSLIEARNRAMHAFWFIGWGDDDDQVIATTMGDAARGKLRFRSTSYSVEDLQELGDRASLLTDGLMGLTFSMMLGGDIFEHVQIPDS